MYTYNNLTNLNDNNTSNWSNKHTFQDNIDNLNLTTDVKSLDKKKYQ